MAGYQSRIRDVINQAAPTHATASTALRGLSQFMDPSLTGTPRFMQKSGFPFPLLTPQMSARLSETAAAGSLTTTIEGSRLLDWLMPGMTVSFELLEDRVIESVQELGDGLVRIVLKTAPDASHVAGTLLTIRRFPVYAASVTVAGDGGIGAAAVSINSPFILIPNDVLVIAGTRFTVTEAVQTAYNGNEYTFDVKTGDDVGLPALSPSTVINVQARAAYRSDLITVPQAFVRSNVRGPAAIDWVSGPVVSDYYPSPESEVFIEEFDATNRQIASARQIAKNDTLTKVSILRDQMLFWRAAEGGVDWDGTYMLLRAYESGRAHLWTPCRPFLDPAPTTTVTTTVPGFAPYPVLLLSRIVPGSVVARYAVTKEVIPDTDYTVNEETGSVEFDSAWASAPVIITYKPRLEWQVSAISEEADVEVVVKIGSEEKQVFTITAANVAQVLTIQTLTSNDLDQIHVTIRRADDASGPLSVRFGDWTPRGSVTSVIRYTLSTGAEIDYDWASSGLIIKPLWPTIELLRAKLDGEATLAHYLDAGRMLV